MAAITNVEYQHTPNIPIKTITPINFRIISVDFNRKLINPMIILNPIPDIADKNIV